MRPDFYYRSLAYIKFSERMYSTVKLIYLEESKAKCFCNYAVLHSSIYRNAEFEINFDYRSLVSEKVGLKRTIVIFFKVFLNWFFRIFKRDEGNSKVLIKTWVELNYKTYEDKVGNNEEYLILVYPFGISFKRQLDYIRFLRKKKITFSLDGIKYSLIDLLRFLLCRDMGSLFELEYNGAQNSCSELLKYKELKSYFVMDDVDPFAYFVNKNLDSKGVSVVSTLHGVGTYSPFYYASELYVFNKVQSDYYSYHFPNLVTHVRYSPRKLSLPIKFERIVFYSCLSPTVRGLNNKVESRVLNKLSTLALKYSIDIQVKLHPNSGSKHEYENFFIFDGVLTNKTLNVSLYSTSYYTVGLGYSVLIETEEIPTSSLFGLNESIVNEINLESIFIGR